MTAKLNTTPQLGPAALLAKLCLFDNDNTQPKVPYNQGKIFS